MADHGDGEDGVAAAEVRGKAALAAKVVEVKEFLRPPGACPEQVAVRGLVHEDARALGRAPTIVIVSPLDALARSPPEKVGSTAARKASPI